MKSNYDKYNERFVKGMTPLATRSVSLYAHLQKSSIVICHLSTLNINIKYASLRIKKPPRVARGGFQNYSLLYFLLLLIDVYLVTCKSHDTIGRCKQRPVTAKRSIETGLELCAALTHNDAAGLNCLAAVKFYPAKLRV
jgi:hypothetical protein